MVTPGVESGEVYVESEDAQPYLKRAEKLEKAGQWRRAIKQYEFIIRKYPESVCPVDAGRFVGVKQYFFQRISQYPPAGLAVYRQMFDALSEGLFNKAVEDSDVIILRRLADEMFFSAYGDNAADFLADLMVEQGYLDEAL
ncbi:MAG: hypothetical protein KAS70_06725, partial [Planctomycetes bacterium]|nr:hypothetical protein [Planctomycetota bacterium]